MTLHFLQLLIWHGQVAPEYVPVVVMLILTELPTQFLGAFSYQFISTMKHVYDYWWNFSLRLLLGRFFLDHFDSVLCVDGALVLGGF